MLVVFFLKIEVAQEPIWIVPTRISVIVVQEEDTALKQTHLLARSK